MFTGIIRETGRLVSIDVDQKGGRLAIQCRGVLAELAVGDSIAVNGVCLTAENVTTEGFQATASPETLRVTTIGELRPGTRVNLEPSLKPADALGGHLVQGHVDGTGRLGKVIPSGDSLIVRFQAPKHILAHCVYKGSVAVDGVSLTISRLGEGWFEASLVPQTQKETSLADLQVGDLVNLENDVISKYVEAHVQRILENNVSDWDQHRRLKRGNQ